MGKEKKNRRKKGRRLLLPQPRMLEQRRYGRPVRRVGLQAQPNERAPGQPNDPRGQGLDGARGRVRAVGRPCWGGSARTRRVRPYASVDNDRGKRNRPFTASFAELKGDVPTSIVYSKIPKVQTSAAAWSNSPPVPQRTVDEDGSGRARPPQAGQFFFCTVGSVGDPRRRSRERTDGLQRRARRTQQNFGGCVVHCANERLLRSALVEERRRTKINQADIKILVDQNVFVLDVTMGEVLLSAPARPRGRVCALRKRRW